MGVIKRSQTISLDSSIFIRALDDHTSIGESSRQLIDQLKDIKPQIFISTMVIEEFFVRVYKEKRDEDIPIYLEFITLNGLCTIFDVDEQIALIAAKLRAQNPSLRAPDAIHLASAISAGAKIFYTTDRRIPKSVDKLKVSLIT